MPLSTLVPDKKLERDVRCKYCGRVFTGHAPRGAVYVFPTQVDDPMFAGWKWKCDRCDAPVFYPKLHPDAVKLFKSK